MDLKIEPSAILDMLLQPAFYVENGTVVEANQAALLRQITIGADLSAHLISGQQAYTEFTDGFLSLSMRIADQAYIASITPFHNGQLIRLYNERDTAESRVLALAAQNLSKPLTSILHATENLFSSDALKGAEGVSDLSGSINHGLYQILRIIKNMEFSSCGPAFVNFETVNIVSVLRELLQKATCATEQSGKKLCWHLPETQLFCLADIAQLERAVFNLLSNAFKFSPADSQIDVELKIINDHIQFTVRNALDPSRSASLNNIFQRYLREPGLDDSLNGIGLGMSIVQTVAAYHSGCLLLDKPDVQTLRATLSMPVKNRENGVLHSPLMVLDYSGGYDRTLVELSDVLPSDMYKTN